MKQTLTFYSLGIVLCMTALAAIPTPDRCAAYLVRCSDAAIEEESDVEMLWELNKCQFSYLKCTRQS
jgi:hypothetical protein